MKLILIEWEDAAHLNPTNAVWVEKESALSMAANEPEICVTVGWLLQETEDYILLAQTRAEDNAQFCGLFKIPNGWVRKKKTLR